MPSRDTSVSDVLGHWGIFLFEDTSLQRTDEDRDFTMGLFCVLFFELNLPISFFSLPPPFPFPTFELPFPFQNFILPRWVYLTTPSISLIFYFAMWTPTPLFILYSIILMLFHFAYHASYCMHVPDACFCHVMQIFTRRFSCVLKNCVCDWVFLR